jgi:hypothetical protein
VRTRRFTTKVNGDRWEVLVTDSDQDVEQWLALTDQKARRIIFREDFLTPAIVRHELFHAYHAYLHLHSSDVSHKDHEEIIAEFLEVRGEDFMKHAKDLWRKIK